MGNHLPVLFGRAEMDRVIVTDRLSLRPFVRDDAPALASLINDYEISKNLARVPFPYSLADAEEFLDWSVSAVEKTRFSAICSRHQPDVMQGAISYEWNAEKANVELGYWLVKPLWGQGLMSEAARAMVHHAFTVAGIDLIVSCFFNENPASGRVLAKAGFEKAGGCMQMSKAQGHDVPVTNMQLSRARWLAQKTFAT
jgi:RimJ/RimL family protein N-acetyltransferase